MQEIICFDDLFRGRNVKGKVKRSIIKQDAIITITTAKKECTRIIYKIISNCFRNLVRDFVHGGK